MASIAAHGVLVILLWSSFLPTGYEMASRDFTIEIVSSHEHQQKIQKDHITSVKQNVAVHSDNHTHDKIAAHIPVLSSFTQHKPALVKHVKNIVTKPFGETGVSLPAPVTFTHIKSPQISATAQRNLVRTHLESFKYYPPSARRRGIEGDVNVHFMLGHGGRVKGVNVVHGSGYAMLDQAALTTVTRAQPFPVQHGEYRFLLRFRRL